MEHGAFPSLALSLSLFLSRLWIRVVGLPQLPLLILLLLLQQGGNLLEFVTEVHAALADNRHAG